MYTSLNTILKHSLFMDASILAGENGTNKSVKRISVFDCPIKDDLLDLHIIEAGDIFISGLVQFEDKPDQLIELIKLLIRGKCSGLIVITNENVSMITQEIMDFCNNNALPVILLDGDIPYAYVIEIINRYIAIENFNILSELKIEKILHNKLSPKENTELLFTINPYIEKYVQAIFISGEKRSDLFNDELNIKHLNQKENIFINSNRTKILIISSNDMKTLQTRVNIQKQDLNHYLNNCILGISGIYDRREINKALMEAKNSLEMAKIMGVSIQEYNPMASSQLLIMLLETNELRNFYDTYLNLLKVNVSSSVNLEELLKTIESYVVTGGDYKKTAELISQHENTVRYRMNRVKCYLQMEDNQIKFHETISLAVKIGLLLHVK